jgi:hypothetical protein
MWYKNKINCKLFVSQKLGNLFVMLIIKWVGLFFFFLPKKKSLLKGLPVAGCLAISRERSHVGGEVTNTEN